MRRGWRDLAFGVAVSGLCAIFAGMLGGCRQAEAPTPLSALNAQQTRGHGVFQAHCSQCHYDRRNEPLHGPSLLGVFKKPALPSGAPANDERVTNTIVNGHNLMPALGDSVDPADRDDLLAYLHTL